MNMFGLVLVALLAPVVVHCAATMRDVTRVRGFVRSCPYQRPATKCSLFSDDQCYEDKDCISSSFKTKCCRLGCNMMCVPPVHYRGKWCKVPVDLGIVFDTKGVRELPVKNMIKEVIYKMSVSKGKTHIALRTIAKDSELLLTFGENQTRRNVLRLINNVAPQKQSGNLSAVVELAKDMFNETNGGRTDAIKVLLVFTDANVGAEEEGLLETASNVPKDAGILVQSVGISSNLSLMGLVEIASSDSYVWDGMDDEMLQEMLAELKKLEEKPCH